MVDLRGGGSRTSEISEKIDQVTTMGLEKLVSITASMIGTGRQLSVGIEGRAATKSGAIWFVAYDDGHTTPITRGENAGKILTECNIVRDILRLGI